MTNVDNFGYIPHTGRASTASVKAQVSDKKRPTKWVRPPSQKGNNERIIGWKKKKTSA